MTLAKHRLLAEAGETPQYAYFPLDGMLSLVGITEDGHTMEFATTGSDGLGGVTLVLIDSVSPYRVIVQMAGRAQRIRGDAFVRECQRCEDLRTVSLTYAAKVFRQVLRTGMCHAFHPLTPRVCRWLLVARACVQANTFELTQEFLADMLGVSRSKVSHALVTLETRGLIHQGRGRIHIIDPRGLQQASCGCPVPSQARIPIQQPLRHAR